MHPLTVRVGWGGICVHKRVTSTRRHHSRHGLAGAGQLAAVHARLHDYRPIRTTTAAVIFQPRFAHQLDRGRLRLPALPIPPHPPARCDVPPAALSLTTGGVTSSEGPVPCFSPEMPPGSKVSLSRPVSALCLVAGSHRIAPFVGIFPAPT